MDSCQWHSWAHMRVLQSFSRGTVGHHCSLAAAGDMLALFDSGLGAWSTERPSLY
jgi:hypothetical protein